MLNIFNYKFGSKKYIFVTYDIVVLGREMVVVARESLIAAT